MSLNNVLLRSTLLIRNLSIHLTKLSEDMLFHSAWFNRIPPDFPNHQKVQYCRSIKSQIESLSLKGFAVIRRSDNQSLKDIEVLNAFILNDIATTQKSFYSLLLKLFNYKGIRSPTKRHSFALSYTSNLFKTVSSAILSVRPLMLSQISMNSQLVELSAMVSLPGAERQNSHSDVPYSKSDKVIAGFMALTKVSLESGPTCLFSGSHTEKFHERHVKSINLCYSSDGSLDVIETCTNENHSNNNLEIDNDVDLTMSSPPFAATLEIGDILIYDASLFHYGGANISVDPRVLLFFSFQESTPWNTIIKINGFTYNCHSSIAGKYSLRSF